MTDATRATLATLLESLKKLPYTEDHHEADDFVIDLVENNESYVKALEEALGLVK